MGSQKFYKPKQVASNTQTGRKNGIYLKISERKHRTTARGERECLHMAKPVGWHFLTNQKPPLNCAANRQPDLWNSSVLDRAQLTLT